MLFDIGRRLLGNATLPPPLAMVATLAELVVVACTVAEALTGDEDEEP